MTRNGRLNRIAMPSPGRPRAWRVWWWPRSSQHGFIIYYCSYFATEAAPLPPAYPSSGEGGHKARRIDDDSDR